MSKFIRTVDAVYGKAKKLSYAMLDLPDLRPGRQDKTYGTLLMDPWTYKNFMSHVDAMYDFAFHEKGRTWRNLLIEVHVYRPPPVLSYDAKVNDVVSLDDEPFLMSIRYEKENGRICYLDDPDTDEVYK